MTQSCVSQPMLALLLRTFFSRFLKKTKRMGTWNINKRKTKQQKLNPDNSSPKQRNPTTTAQTLLIRFLPLLGSVGNSSPSWFSFTPTIIIFHNLAFQAKAIASRTEQIILVAPLNKYFFILFLLILKMQSLLEEEGACLISTYYLDYF